MTIRSGLETIVTIPLTEDERRRLLARYAVGNALLQSPPAPNNVDEVGQPVLTRPAWEEDKNYTALTERIGQAVHSLRSGTELTGSQDAISYIGTCVAISLVNDGMSGSRIFDAAPGENPDIDLYHRLLSFPEVTAEQ